MGRRRKVKGQRDPVTGVTKLPYVEPKWAKQVEPLRIRGGRTGGKSRPISIQDQNKETQK